MQNVVKWQLMKSSSPFPKDVYERNARIYKMLANAKRLEILNILKENPTNVNELARILGVPKANISQHLAILRYLKVVKVEKKGKNSVYSITNPEIVAPCEIFKNLWEDSSFNF